MPLAADMLRSLSFLGWASLACCLVLVQINRIKGRSTLNRPEFGKPWSQAASPQLWHQLSGVQLPAGYSGA